MQQILEDLGLSSKAISIYLALLQKGASSVEAISLETGINRTSVYPYVNELKEFGLIVWDERNVHKALTAQDPHRLLEIAEKKSHQLSLLKQNLSQLMPQMEAMHQINSSEYYVMKYVGVEKCRSALEQLYTFSEMKGYCGDIFYRDLGISWYENHLKKMYKQFHIFDRVIFPIDQLKKTSYSNLKKTSWYCEQYAQYRVHPDLHFPKGVDVYISSDRVLTLYSEPKPTCVVIKSQKYWEYQSALFEALWTASTDIKDSSMVLNN